MLEVSESKDVKRYRKIVNEPERNQNLPNGTKITKKMPKKSPKHTKQKIPKETKIYQNRVLFRDVFGL